MNSSLETAQSVDVSQQQQQQQMGYVPQQGYYPQQPIIDYANKLGFPFNNNGQPEEQLMNEKVPVNQQFKSFFLNTKELNGAEYLMNSMKQFNKENAKKCINVLSFCMLALLIILFSYRFEYWPMWVYVLSCCVIAIGVIAQITRNYILMATYCIYNIFCAAAYGLVLQLESTRTGLCFAFLLISLIKAIEFIGDYWKEKRNVTTTKYLCNNLINYTSNYIYMDLLLPLQ
ncbi:hypothetical protein ABK040_005028 [Willaertia magna]